jgi:hypothetical protein
MVALLLFAGTCYSREHEVGAGFAGEFAASLQDVLQALQDVLQDETIHGTKMFDRDQALTGAVAVKSTTLFEPWTGDGQVFYKIRKDTVAPRHFLDTADQGTVAVRYVVTSVSPERTRLRINAIFVENFHRTVHLSDGTVESSEYRLIQDHVQAILFAEQEAADAQRRRDGLELARQTLIRQREDEATRLAAAQSSVEGLQQQVATLRHELQRRVKAPGATLKAAPFKSAANIANLAAYTDLVIVIVTPRWYGVETPDGQRGWLPLDEMEALP